MKPFIINKDSWHHHIASTFGGWTNCYGEDFCSYVRHVFGGVCLIFLLIVIGSILGTGLIHLVLGAIFSAIYHAYLFTMAGEMALVILLLGVGATVILWAFHFVGYLVRLIRKEAEGSTPGFVKQAYRSYKEKYCMDVSYEDSKE